MQPIHIPAYMVELIAKWKKASRDLEEELGRQPNTKELAKRLDLPEKKVRIIKKAVRASQRPSQEGGGGDNDAPSLGEFVADDRMIPPDEAVLLTDNLETISVLLDAIDDREATILRLRYGLEGDAPLTLKELGTVVGLTRDRVRQIEIEALRKLNDRMNSDRPLAAIRAREAVAARRGA